LADHVSGTWQITPGQALLYRAWDDEFVLYNNLSGDTHLLGVDAIQLLLTLQDGAADPAALAASLRARCGFEDEPDLEGQVGGLLDELALLSLVQPGA
jgi:PqqD family protein of HPr-rel-A system